MHIFYGYLIVKCVTPTQFSQDILLFKSSDIERKIKRRERERERGTEYDKEGQTKKHRNIRTEKQ